MFEWLTLDMLENILLYYERLGTIFCILLTFLEAFIPFLPLFVIVVANASAYGLIGGFLLSWIGTVLGAYCVFLIVRKFSRYKFLHFLTEQKGVHMFIRMVEIRGISLLLVLLCFPFTPVLVLNIVAGLSKIKKLYYFIALLIGKPIMILCMSYIGSDLMGIVRSPVKLLIVVILIIAVWFAGKAVENYLNNKVARDLRAIEQKDAVK